VSQRVRSVSGAYSLLRVTVLVVKFPVLSLVVVDAPQSDGLIGYFFLLLRMIK